MTDEDLQGISEDGLWFIKELEDGRSIVLNNFIFTMGLIVLCADYAKARAQYWNGFERRFCYENPSDALKAAVMWDGTGDPPGPWVKEKSIGVDRLNPNLADAMFDE